jgi:hypothetical protein
VRVRASGTTGRIGLGVVGGVFAFGMLAAPAGAQDPDPPPDPIQIAAAVALYLNEFSNADLDGDGLADFADTDGDGIPNFVPEGFAGDADRVPGDGRFGEEVTAAILVTGGIEGAFTNDDGSKLLYDCGGMAISYDESGAMVDWAIGIGSNEGGGPNGQLIDLFPLDPSLPRAFTKSNPFLVKDRVVYFGRMPGDGDGANNHMWYIRTAGISLDEGGDDNPDLNNRNAGEVIISGDVPGGTFLIPSGIFPVEGDLDSENGVQCYGEGWVEFDTGNPVLSAAGMAAALAGLGGIVGLLFNARPAITWRV